MSTPLTSFEKLVWFVRSVLPEQPEQVVMLLGSALLLTVFRLSSWHEWVIALMRTQGHATGLTFTLLTGSTLAAVYSGGAAGLHLCFFPKANPLAWLKRFVYLPVILGWAMNIGLRYYFGYRYPGVQDEFARMMWSEHLQHDSFWGTVGLSFWVTFVALACIWLASWSIRSGEMTLPVSFCDARGPATDFQTRRFAWLMVVWTTPATSIVLITTFSFANPALLGGSHVALAELFTQLVLTVSFVAILLFAVKAVASALFRASLKFPPIRAVGLSVVFPLIVTSIPGFVKFAMARVRMGTERLRSHRTSGFGEILRRFSLIPIDFRAGGRNCVARIPAAALDLTLRALSRNIFRWDCLGRVSFCVRFRPEYALDPFCARHTWAIAELRGVGICAVVADSAIWRLCNSGRNFARADECAFGVGMDEWCFGLVDPPVVGTVGPRAVALLAAGITPAEPADEARDDEFRDMPDVEAGTA
jgi:hypothetical protein